MPEVMSESEGKSPIAEQGINSVGLTAIEVSLSFADDDLSKPRWSFVRPEVFEFEDYLSLGPMWATTEAEQPYDLSISLQDPKVEFVSAELFSSTDGQDPVKFTIAPSRAEVDWPGLVVSGWQRWVYRIWVHREGVKDMPVHLAFSASDPDARSLILSRIARGVVNSDPEAIGMEEPAANTPTLATKVTVAGDSVFFSSWYDYSGLALPTGLSLEPLIVFKALDQDFKFQFENAQGLFVGCESTPCNRGGLTVPPLSLVWEGVDPPPVGPCDNAAGFVNSTLRDVKTLARVLWHEPSEGEIKRTSSFFFSFSNLDRPELSRPVDPTIVHDPDLPP